MATNVLTELDQQLASLNQLKPPGASKSKISSITTLCVNNIQAESNLVQSLYRALKKAPATHKLGAIYVIDSVVRRWIEQAKLKGQELNIEGRGEPGTFSAAVKRVTELMPALFDDIMKGLPANQKDKLESMVKIWEKGNTFPPKLLGEFREKLSGETNKAAVHVNNVASKQSEAPSKFAAPVPSRPLHTPIGFPPQHLYDQGFLPRRAGDQPVQQQHAPQPTQTMSLPQPPQPTAPTQDVNSILASLASLQPAPVQPPPQQVVAPSQQQAAPAPQQQPQQLPPNLAAFFGQQSMQAPPPQPQPTFSTPQPPQPPFQLPQGYPPFPPQQPPSVAQQFSQAPPPPQPASQPSDPLAPLRHILPANIINDQQKLVQALKLLQDLQKDGIPMEQWQPVLSAFAEQYQPPAQSQQQYGAQGFGNRGRSRSPDRGGPGHGGYGNDQNGNGHDRYRQRSPLGQGSEFAMNGNPMQPKYIAIDSNLPSDHIKVLSRTLFVGGASGTQKEIQDLFEQFGQVQTCIANQEKRHAFVKMTTRAHALNAKAQMEKLQSTNDRYVMHVARQTKWGVGFGPRECCDYQRGESVIPIWKLTEADMKWLLTAEYGGTGGRKVESGMVLEEPDIEIGAGVSSKAMSKRAGPEHTGSAPGHHGHHQQHHGKRGRNDDGGGGHRRKEKRQRYFDQVVGGGGQQQQQQQGGGGGGYGGGYGGGKGGQMEAYGYARPEPVAVATPPAVPGFGMPFPGAGGAF